MVTKFIYTNRHRLGVIRIFVGERANFRRQHNVRSFFFLYLQKKKQKKTINLKKFIFLLLFGNSKRFYCRKVQFLSQSGVRSMRHATLMLFANN